MRQPNTFLTKQLSAALNGIGLVGLLILSGCHSAGSYAKLEQQLRRQESEIRSLQTELAETEQNLRDQDQQLAAHRMQPSSKEVNSRFAMVSDSKVSDTTNILPEEVAIDWGSVQAIRIQKLVSGIRQSPDGRIVHVVIQPLDEDGELRKVAGQLSVSVQKADSPTNAGLLAEKSWSITESRSLWTKGFVSSGFHAQLPLPESVSTPKGTQLIVRATLNLGRGRTFEVTETLKVSPPTEGF